MCKFVYIFRTDENPSGSCQPYSNNIHIMFYDDNMYVQPTDVQLQVGLLWFCIKINVGQYSGQYCTLFTKF